MGTRCTGKSKNHRRILAFICMIAVLAGCVSGGYFAVKHYSVPRTAHVSIDDATAIFMDIYRNEPESIFDNAILSKLKHLHDAYGLKVTLYVYEILDDFAIWQMPLDYKKEFIENADWLKIGFHSISDDNPETSGMTLDEFSAEYRRTESAVSRFAGYDSVAHVLRLHYWYATSEMTDFLNKQGVTGLLCSEEPSQSYDLTEKQEEKLYDSRDGRLTGEMTYYVTDLRLEDEEDISAALAARKKDHIIVLFTHAWCFEENYAKMEEAVGWFAENQYEFGFLEETEE